MYHQPPYPLREQLGVDGAQVRAVRVAEVRLDAPLEPQVVLEERERLVVAPVRVAALGKSGSVSALLKTLGTTIDRFHDRTAFVNSWGDGLFMVFADVATGVAKYMDNLSSAA